MSMAELFITMLVALVVFGPKKLPMVARHLGRLLGRFNHYKQQAAMLWQQQLKEQQLQENIKKAQKADASYENDIKL